MKDQPEEIRLIPTNKPMAHVAVLGRPAQIRMPASNETMPLAIIQNLPSAI